MLFNLLKKWSIVTIALMAVFFLSDKAYAHHIDWEGARKEYLDYQGNTLIYNANKGTYLKADVATPTVRWRAFIVRGEPGDSFTIYAYDEHGNIMHTVQEQFGPGQYVMEVCYQTLGLPNAPQIRMTGNNSQIHLVYGAKNTGSVFVFGDMSGQAYPEDGSAAHNDYHSGGGGGGGGCDGCATLGQMLNCPYWDDYMSEFENTIRRALHPPPDWNEVAGIFRDTIVPRLINDLENLLGYAPNPPSRNQIANQLPDSQPDINDSVGTIDADMPFDQPLDFDVGDFEEIEIRDESEAFEIEPSPLDQIDADPPGQPVIPGDPKNDMGGIKEPDQVPTETPEYNPPDYNPPDIPDDPMPVPNPSPGEGDFPVPNVPGGGGGGDTPYYKDQPSQENPL